MTIVGATFDESLEGIIRVSVVATGIDHVAAARPAGTVDSRISELTQKVRKDTQRLAERIEPQVRPTPASADKIASAAHAAVAAAILPSATVEDVSIRPIPRKPSLFEPAGDQLPLVEMPAPQAFIPPPPERTAARIPRMPRIDELPIQAQKEIKAKRGELDDEHPEKRRLSLMQRLASVGLGRREQAEGPPPVPLPARPIPKVAPPRPAARAAESPAPDPVSEYARRAAPQGLDPHGRPVPVHNSPEDDQLDIPAFLRRQAN